MNLLTWLLLGLVVGALAKLLMPGKDGGGFVLTTLLGIAGAFVGGFIGALFGIGSAADFSFGSLALSTLGALILLWGHRRLRGGAA
jgi:uncharacterized membrane protein YeaQ/YmgE (transglycosylase-associated protein family)